MPTWLIGLGSDLLKQIFGGLFSWISGEKKRADQQRIEGLKAERESIRKAAIDERRINEALTSGKPLRTPSDWNQAIEDPWRW